MAAKDTEQRQLFLLYQCVVLGVTDSIGSRSHNNGTIDKSAKADRVQNEAMRVIL